MLVHAASSSDELFNEMAEGVVLAAAWFTVRMVCQHSYKAIKSYQVAKREKAASATEKKPFSPAYRPPAVSAEEEANAETWAPWGPADEKTAEQSSQASGSLSDDDRTWVEELHRATNNSRARDNLRLLGEIQGLEDKVDNIPVEALYDKLRHAMKLLLEYLQNPSFRGASTTLEQAEEAAKYVYTNERSLVMSLSALRLRIVITYLHCPKHSKGLQTSLDDKHEDKRQCELYVSNALKQGPLETLCQRFLQSRDSQDKGRREQVEVEVMLAFDIILEVISSVYMLEPFKPSQGPLPKGAPDIVIQALSAYCKSGLGNSVIYGDVARALQEWESKPERQEKWALHCLYQSTEGSGWACNEGWDNLFETDLSALYGVSTHEGRVTKISLGANNLEGRLPPQLQNLEHLQELSLPGNKLFGKIPSVLWDLPCLRVVALQGNSFTVTPPGAFRPAGSMRAAARGSSREIARRHRGIAGTVEARNPARLDVYKGEWFVCSWKITNTGGVAFGRRTKFSRGDDHSVLGGVEDVAINPLAPGEDQTVSVMMQAPNYDAWALKDEWALVGEGLDFIDDIDAKAQTPIVSVIARPAGGRKDDGDANMPTLANNVFVADSFRRGGSSQFSLNSSQYFNLSSHYSSSRKSDF
eukprot:g4924.t1